MKVELVQREVVVVVASVGGAGSGRRRVGFVQVVLDVGILVGLIYCLRRRALAAIMDY